MPLVPRLLLAAVAGIVVAISFEPLALVYLLPFGVAGLTLLLRRQSPGRGLLVGAVFGTAFMLVLLPWLRVIGVDAWILLSVVEGLFYGLLGMGGALVQRLPWWPLWTAMLWAGAEALRSTVPFGGFPWGRLSFATVDTPVAPLYEYVGSAGVTFAVALVGTGLAWAVLAARRSPVRGAAAVVVPSLLAVSGGLVPAGGPSPQVDRSRTVSVAAVQGNVPGVGMEAFARQRAVLDNHVEATRQLAEQVASGQRPAPDLVIWPENSTDIDPFSDPTAYDEIQGAVDAVGVPVLVGAMVSGRRPTDVYNQGIVWDPGTGPAQRYSKMHPVPFGEYIPLRDMLAHYIRRLDQIPRDMVPGRRPGVLSMGRTTVGDVICFEVAYDQILRNIVKGGAGLVVVQTNNATYMGTGQVEQQFAIARLRAIETNRYVVVAATDGVSGMIAPDGHVIERAPTRTMSLLTHTLPVFHSETPAVRWGEDVEMLLTLGAAVSVSAAIALGYRRRRAAGRPAREGTPETVAVGAGEA